MIPSPYPDAPAPSEPEAPAGEYLDDEELLRRAKQCFDRAAETESEYRILAKQDLEFFSGQQWDKNIENLRKADLRPCLTINRLPAMVHQVSNDIRQNKPAPDVSPVDDTGDIETAEVLQGLIRHIERQSKADAVRSYAAFYQVACGRGYYRIVTEAVDPMGFDQEIFLRRVKNPATVYFDPSCQQPDYSDAWWALIVEDLTKEQYKAKYPEFELSSAEDFGSTGDSTPPWRSEGGGIRVAEYWYKVRERTDIALLPDGSVKRLSEVPPGMPVLKTRPTEIDAIHWARINGAEVMERREWPGRYIPIVPVLGEEYDLDGKTELVGMIRHAKDPQRMLNYWESAKTEMIALAPRVPFIVAEGQLENHEDEWRQANVRNYAFLYYKPKSVGQELVPPPQRQVYEPPIQAITLAQAQTVDHLKSTTGIYDASLGNRSNETSGLAIRTRQQQGDTGNYHYIDNLATAITHETRILIDLIPKIYDRPGRVARIIGDDGSEESVVLNAPYKDRHNVAKDGHYLEAGRYDVAINIGPSYATKRQESADAMMQFAAAAPELTPRYADLLVEAMDWPNAEAIADRIRPPNVPPKGQEKAIPPQAQAMIQQLQQENKQLTLELNDLAGKVEAKQLELESKERMQTQELQSKERVAAQQSQVKLTTEGAKLGTPETSRSCTPRSRLSSSDCSSSIRTCLLKPHSNHRNRLRCRNSSRPMAESGHLWRVLSSLIDQGMDRHRKWLAMRHARCDTPFFFNGADADPPPVCGGLLVCTRPQSTGALLVRGG